MNSPSLELLKLDFLSRGEEGAVIAGGVDEREASRLKDEEEEDTEEAGALFELDPTIRLPLDFCFSTTFEGLNKLAKTIASSSSDSDSDSELQSITSLFLNLLFIPPLNSSFDFPLDSTSISTT